MPGQRLPMRKIRDVLRLTAAGMSSRKIAASLVVGATTVVDCLQRARAAGVSWPLLDDLPGQILTARLAWSSIINSIGGATGLMKNLGLSIIPIVVRRAVQPENRQRQQGVSRFSRHGRGRAVVRSVLALIEFVS